jgi:cell division protein FtsN
VFQHLKECNIRRRSKDYKAKGPSAARTRSNKRSGSSLLVGILVGLVLGLGIALGVAWYINKVPSPFSGRNGPPTPPAPLPRLESKAPAAKTAKVEEKDVKEDKPRFDFYDILPGSKEATPEKPAKENAKGSTGTGKEAFFLQAGSFQNAPDADNLKARLALLGVEASIETTALPDKGTWHRVRIGPYTSVEELNRTRDNLKQNGVQTTLVKARETER